MIDLHCHSIFSDGDLTPSELLKKANELQLSYFSITDHNNCLAYEKLNNSNFKGILIPGVEITTSFGNHIIEILGYGVDIEKINDWYRKNTPDIAEQTRYICNSLIEIFNKKGIRYTKIENIDKTINGKPKQYFYNDLLKYSENKEKIGEEILKSFANFTKKGLNNPESILFINEASRYQKLEDIVELIHKSNGLCFLAHVYQYNIENHIEFIDKMRSIIKLDGIEVYHCSFSKEQIYELDRYANNNNLYKCGGSDYHGKLKPGIKLGLEVENSEKMIEQWIDRIKLIK